MIWTTEDVRKVAGLNGLDLDEERAAAASSQLATVVAEAHALNEFMAARRDIPPAVRFFHSAPS